MKRITLEWVQKAEGDFATAERELRARPNPNYDAACFHAQQCIEKYLKGKLQEADIHFEKIHDLSPLLDLLLPIEPNWETLREDLNALTTLAVEYRYPGEMATEAEAPTAVVSCQGIRRILRESLGLES